MGSRVTKEQFRNVAGRMIDALTSLDDDVWGIGFPAISVRVGDELVTVSLNVLDEDDDGEDDDDN